MNSLNSLEVALDSLTIDDVETEWRNRIRYKCRTDLFYLLTKVLRRHDINHPWLEARCREVQEFPDNYLDLWARDHRKSSIITFGKTIQDILRSHGDGAMVEREATFGIFSHSRPIAKGFLRQIKTEFEGNQELRDLFPDIFWNNPQREAPKWSEDDGIVVKRKSNPKESTVEAWGLVDAMPTGKHFTHRVYDDVVVPASVTTPDMMKKTEEAIALSNNLGTQGGVKRFIGTRYHYNDAYRTLIDSGTVIPRIYPATKDGTADGEPILLTKEELDEKRREQGSYIFSCQMLLNPKGDETQLFLREYLSERHRGVKFNEMNIYLLFDPAGEKKKSSDYTSGWVVGLNPDNRIYILDMVRDKLSLSQRTALMMDWHRKYHPIQTRYEKYGKDSDIEHIKSTQERENYRFEITPVGGATPKNDRIRRLIPYFEQKRIVFPTSLYYTKFDGSTVDLVSEFIEQEYTCFPVPIHDDMLDALARLIEPDLPLIWPQKKIKSNVNRQRGYSSWEEY